MTKEKEEKDREVIRERKVNILTFSFNRNVNICNGIKLPKIINRIVQIQY